MVPLLLSVLIQPLISSFCYWSNSKVAPDLNWTRTLQECQQKPCRRTCSPRSLGTYTKNWTNRKTGILSAVIAYCCIRQQFDLTRGFVCKGDAYLKGPVYKSTIARPGTHRNTWLAIPITLAVRDLKFLTSNTQLTPQWKSETWCTILWQK